MNLDSYLSRIKTNTSLSSMIKTRLEENVWKADKYLILIDNKNLHILMKKKAINF